MNNVKYCYIKINKLFGLDGKGRIAKYNYLWFIFNQNIIKMESYLIERSIKVDLILCFN